MQTALDSLKSEPNVSQQAIAGRLFQVYFQEHSLAWHLFFAGTEQQINAFFYLLTPLSTEERAALLTKDLDNRGSSFLTLLWLNTTCVNQADWERSRTRFSLKMTGEAILLQALTSLAPFSDEQKDCILAKSSDFFDDCTIMHMLADTVSERLNQHLLALLLPLPNASLRQLLALAERSINGTVIQFLFYQPQQIGKVIELIARVENLADESEAYQRIKETLLTELLYPFEKRGDFITQLTDLILTQMATSERASLIVAATTKGRLLHSIYNEHVTSLEETACYERKAQHCVVRFFSRKKEEVVSPHYQRLLSARAQLDLVAADTSNCAPTDVSVRVPC